MAYNVTAKNITAHPRTFFALYTGPSNSGTGHIILKLSTKKLVPTSNINLSLCLKTLSQLNEIANKEEIADEIEFHNIHHKSTLSDLYTALGKMY